MADEEMKMTGMSVSPPSFPPCHPPLSAHLAALPRLLLLLIFAGETRRCVWAVLVWGRASEGRKACPSVPRPRTLEAVGT